MSPAFISCTVFDSSADCDSVLEMLSDNQTIYSVIAIILIVLMHLLYVGIAKMLNRISPGWSTAAGGFAVGYVLLLLLPKLSAVSNYYMDDYPGYPMLGMSIIYIFALLGFVSYRMVDLLSTYQDSVSASWRRVQSTSFFLYNVSIGEMVFADLSFIPSVSSLPAPSAPSTCVIHCPRVILWQP